MKILLLLSALLLVTFAAHSSFAQSTDKDTLLKAAAALEADPLGKQAKDFRAWAVTYVIETKDVNIIVCGGPTTAPFLDKKNKYGSELVSQYTIGMAAFKLANPDKATDENAAQLAGVESALKIYEIILKEKPKAKFAGMDDLVAKRNSGDLKKLVDEANCGKK